MIEVFMSAPRMNDRETRLREILLETKRKLWYELRSELFQESAEGMQSQFELALDPAERGLIDLLEDTGLQIADIRRQELTALDEATGRLEQGTYGVCEECGKDIPQSRLRVMPFARYCVDDQKKEEGPSRPPGVTM
jgi:DnaK suppressor protein